MIYDTIHSFRARPATENTTHIRFCELWGWILGFNMLQPFFGKQMVSIEVSTTFQPFFGRNGPILCFFWSINWVQITRCSESPPASVRRRFPRNVVPKDIATKKPGGDYGTMALWTTKKHTTCHGKKIWMYFFKNAA